jgi:hypothetical protein
MGMYIKFLTTICLILSFSSLADISITTVNNSDNELKIKRDLESLLIKYDLSPWIYTNKVEVDKNAKTPHSHPVLTMSTQKEYLSSNIKFLSSFLHEQFHWHVIMNGKGSKNGFREAIYNEFPDVQFERPLGSGSKGGTLSHIVVCYLEFVALAELVGHEKAIQNLSTNEYYTWVYQTIINPQNQIKLDKLVRKFGLEFGNKNS